MKNHLQFFSQDKIEMPKQNCPQSSAIPPRTRPHERPPAHTHAPIPRCVPFAAFEWVSLSISKRVYGAVESIERQCIRWNRVHVGLWTVNKPTATGEHAASDTKKKKGKKKKKERNPTDMANSRHIVFVRWMCRISTYASSAQSSYPFTLLTPGMYFLIRSIL